MKYLKTRHIFFLKTTVILFFLLPVSISTIRSASGCHSASVFQIVSNLDLHGPSNDVIYIFQDGGHGAANKLPVFSLVKQLVSMGRRLSVCQIWSKSVNFRLS